MYISYYLYKYHIRIMYMYITLIMYIYTTHDLHAYHTYIHMYITYKYMFHDMIDDMEITQQARMPDNEASRLRG